MIALAQRPATADLVKRLRTPGAWIDTVDMLAILMAASLPWSTSLPAIFNAVLLACMVPFLDVKAFLDFLKRPVCVLPVAMFFVAFLGTLWSDAPWGTRLHAVGPTIKLLVLPVLLYHFQRSARGVWVFAAFLISCALLALMSWLVLLEPTLSLKPKEFAERGIFVKNYLDQSQEFTLCAVALAYPVAMALRAKRHGFAAGLTALGLLFFSNMAFVVVSRTALVTVPIMLGVFAFLHLRWRSILLILCACLALAWAAWQASAQLRMTVERFGREYELYTQQNIATSIGLRIEFWRKSLRFFAEAPLIGHGTGSTRGLFEQAASGAKGTAAGEVISNPHNQTLNVAVQWGIMGVLLLYAMWLAHLMLFRGEGLANWIGLLVVVQNVFTSLFNSHLFDFHEGWMYVMGVSVAGGMVLQKSRQEAAQAAVPLACAARQGA